MKVTALLGAGAYLNIDGTSTNKLTKLVTDYKIKYKKNTDPFFKKIEEKHNDHWKTKPCNFEDIFHTLEMLHSYKWYDFEKDYFKPPFEAFVIPNPDDKGYYFSPNRLKEMKHLITIIADEVERYDKKFQLDKDNKHQWYTKFWQKAVANCEWNIATLNYDTCLENSINTFEDGYKDIGYGCYKYSPIQIREPGLSKILHLHGCILYGYPPNNNTDYYFEKDANDLYKFSDYCKAKQSWSQRFNNTNQSHETSIIGPIITGLGKTDKILCYPYMDYSNLFYESLLDNDRLLIAGYSFGDQYLNKMLQRIAYLPNYKRIVIITYCNEKDYSWNNKDHCNLTPFEDFVNKCTKTFHPFKDNCFVTKGPAESKDGNFKLYFRGMKNAIENYGDNIIDFLTT